MSALRVAVIGYGLAGRVFHGPLIAATPDLEVAAIVTGDPGRGAQAALDHPAAAIEPTPDALWARAPTLDLVVVASANDAHVALADAAIAHGLAVVVDKPLAADASAAAGVVARAADAGVLLTVFQNRRWDYDQRVLGQLLADGALGTVHRVESRLERWRPEPALGAWRERQDPGEGGGLLLDLGSHLVDQVLHGFGPAHSVYAEIAHLRGLPGDDDIFLSLAHASGTISHLHASALVAAPGPRLRVLGSEAALVVTAPDMQEDRLRAGERPDAAPDWGAPPEYARPRLVVGERSVPLDGAPGDWPAFYRELAHALRTGGPPPVDPQDAVATLRVLDAARVSARERRVVELASG